jgi:hypothetical protein
MSRARHPDDPRPGHNRGAALLIMLLAMVLAFGAVLIGSLAANDPEIERQRRSFEALAQAKQALIAWSVVQGDVQPTTETEGGVKKFTHRRPGPLPCPDDNYFGSADSGYSSGSCSTSGGTSLSRLPWKSLGVDRLRDAHGEVLWYAISDNFRNNLSYNHIAINSDTKGTLRLYAADGNTLLTPDGEELAAVIIAPGPPLPGQDRSNSSKGDSQKPSKLVSEYLEAFNGKNNASVAGPFIAGPIRDSSGHLIVNDLVIGLTVRELVSGLERRALDEAQGALKKYADEHEHYPNPAPFDDADCMSSITDVRSDIPLCATSDVGTPVCHGRLPEDVFSPEVLSPEESFPYVAPWFLQNGWGRVMIYAISDAAAGCTSPLKVDGVPKRYVLFAPGTARAGQSRPSTVLSNYLEDAANADAWSGDPNFSAPGAGSNDQLRAVP